MKLIKFITLITFIVLGFALCTLRFALPIHAQVQPLPTSSVPEAKGVVEIQALETLFSNILAVATALAGLAVFIMLIAGGLSWLTSGGDPKKVESARNTITYAIAGLVLLILAWLILRFIKEFTGVDVTIFQLPSGPTPTP